MQKYFVIKTHHLKKFIYYVLWVINVFVITQLQSETWAQATDSPCSSLSSVQEVLECALQNHPDIKKAKISVRQGTELESQASQVPNPELESKSTYSNQLGDKVMNSEVSLAPIFELGGKRGARIGKARADQEKIETDLLKIKETIYSTTLLSLYRLRQIQHETSLIDEGLTTFSKIQRIFKSRLKLSPEQQVLLGVFQLAEGDYKIRMTNISAEMKKTQQYLSIAIGKPFIASAQILPSRKTSWPEFPATTLTDPLNGSQIKAAQAELKSAEAEVELAKSASWPDLKLGPTFELQTQGPFSFQAYGVALSLPLPIFNQNGGGRAVAYRGLDRAEVEVQSTHFQLSTERSILLQRYQDAVKSLQESSPISEIEKKHQDMEVLFQRGLVPGQLVIEAHRQIFDFTKSQNELELSAIETLLNIYTLAGKLFEEKP